ncbi:serine/threonine-protein kinase [Nonomuraea sp. NPDC050153]|uniref:serine/threonine-protein kinase n=1 Tax=Nonomuraea sp. NPDC050153 TaxID=3364359 RepID=UPI0037BA2FA8
MVMTSAQPGYMVSGRYRLIAVLGSGGFGRVWRAHDQVLDVDVAIKELQLLPGMSKAEQDKRLERTAREARNAVRLRAHENIVAIHDIVSDDLPWIVMELIDGQSLHEHLDTQGPLPVEQAVQLAAGLLAALGAAHQAGIVHRDIKPANVMLSAEGRVLLTDFGIAVHTTDTTLTATGMLIGSPEYMAPERLRGTDGLPASDLFSLGVTLYQAVEGVSPFRRDTQPAALTAVLLEDPPPPQRAGRLAPLITRLLDKDPHSRPTVEETLAMLGEQQPSRVHVRDRTKILPSGQGWQRKGVAVMMAIIFALGVLGLANALGVLGLPAVSDPWAYMSRKVMTHPLGVALAVVLVTDIGLAGLLCAQVARFLAPIAGMTVAILGGAAGFLAGAGAVVLAFDGIAVLLAMMDTDGGGRPWVIPLIVITVIMFLTGGWAWESRKAWHPRGFQKRGSPSS